MRIPPTTPCRLRFAAQWFPQSQRQLYLQPLIDDSSDRFDGNFLDSYNLKLTRASSNFDQRHVFNISYVYDLPFFSHDTGFAHTLLGNWQLSGITTFQTGTPFSIRFVSPGDNAGVANSLGKARSRISLVTRMVRHPLPASRGPGDGHTAVLQSLRLRSSPRIDLWQRGTQPSQQSTSHQL